MIFDHFGFTVRDLAKSKSFYANALAPLGIHMLVDKAEWETAAFGVDHPEFWIGAGEPTNGEDEAHLCFRAKSRKEVDAFYAAAMAAGGRDNGKPGLRTMYHPDYYGAFVLDPDGNGIEACCHAPE